MGSRKNIQKIFVYILFFFITEKATAQKTFTFSVKQTIDFAMKNAMDVKNALIDIQIQKQTNRDFTSIAYPQIN